MRRTTMAVMSVISGVGLVSAYRATLPPTPTTATLAAVSARGSTSETTRVTAKRATGSHKPVHVSGMKKTPTPAAAVSGQPHHGAPATTVPPSTGGAAANSSQTTTAVVTGAATSTQWGTVQVQITVTNGKITAATALQYPQGNGNSQAINAYALPILEAETVQAGSAQISAVSGATITSGGYQTSLQSAIDQAHL